MIEEEVYIEQPRGFEVEDRVTHVCKLKKDRYGMKQDPRPWYGRIPVINGEWCLGYSTQTRKQECGVFQVDLQNKRCC